MIVWTDSNTNVDVIKNGRTRLQIILKHFEELSLEPPIYRKIWAQMERKN